MNSASKKDNYPSIVAERLMQYQAEDTSAQPWLDSTSMTGLNKVNKLNKLQRSIKAFSAGSVLALSSLGLGLSLIHI